MNNNNIFINCPFDNQYIADLLKPMLYAVLNFGFEPQLALNRSDSGENRLNKIVELIKKSENSIHDLSRIKSSKTKEYYPRIARICDPCFFFRNGSKNRTCY